MSAAIIALSLVLFCQMLAHTEEFRLLEDAYASDYMLDPSPEKLFQKTQSQEVSVTAYTPDQKENWGGLSTTAFGTKLTLGTIAVSQDLHKRGWKKGRYVFLEGLGRFKINDLMHKRHRNKIDVLVLRKKAACDFGVKNCKAILLSEGY